MSRIIATLPGVQGRRKCLPKLHGDADGLFCSRADKAIAAVGAEIDQLMPIVAETEQFFAEFPFGFKSADF